MQFTRTVVDEQKKKKKEEEGICSPTREYVQPRSCCIGLTKLNETFCANCGFGRGSLRRGESDPIGRDLVSIQERVRSFVDNENSVWLEEKKRKEKETGLVRRVCVVSLFHRDSRCATVRGMGNLERKYSACNFPAVDYTAGRDENSGRRPRKLITPRNEKVMIPFGTTVTVISIPPFPIDRISRNC